MSTGTISAALEEENSGEKERDDVGLAHEWCEILKKKIAYMDEQGRVVIIEQRCREKACQCELH